jgi:hypothetical protein
MMATAQRLHAVIRVRRAAVVLLLLGLTIAPADGCSGSQVAGPPSVDVPPDHLMVLVFDQMRPDYIDRFSLPHFQRLRASSRHYPEAYVGHLGSQTVVSHLVIPTGLPPKALPWQDDVAVDPLGALGKPGAAYETGKLTREQFWTLLAHLPPSTYLPYRVRQKTGHKVIAIGEKDYATLMFGTPSADAIVTLAKASGQFRPAGVNVPDYIASNPRFALDCRATYGTGLSTIYALDGNHYVPGNDPAHLGGDTWTADAALEVMAREDWGGLFLTFGGIDKVAHMLGEQDGHGLHSVPSGYHLADIAKNADAQLGRLLDALQSRDLLERTLIVVTADHGGQKNEFYLGNNKYQSCCPLENSEAKVEPSYWIDHLNQRKDPLVAPLAVRGTGGVARGSGDGRASAGRRSASPALRQPLQTFLGVADQRVVHRTRPDRDEGGIGGFRLRAMAQALLGAGQPVFERRHHAKGREVIEQERGRLAHAGLTRLQFGLALEGVVRAQLHIRDAELIAHHPEVGELERVLQLADGLDRPPGPLCEPRLDALAIRPAHRSELVADRAGNVHGGRRVPGVHQEPCGGRAPVGRQLRRLLRGRNRRGPAA